MKTDDCGKRGVWLDERHTTATLPHKRLASGGRVYYVATYPEGDLAIHEHDPRWQNGYGGSDVTFLLEDGTYETVRGPFSCGDIFDNGRSGTVSGLLGIPKVPAASRVIVGRHLPRWTGEGTREVIREESARSCEVLGPRIAAALKRELPPDFEVEIEYRCSSSFLRRDEVDKYMEGVE